VISFMLLYSCLTFFLFFLPQYYMHSTKQYPWYLTALIGWVYALIGLNIQHDANHGSVSRNPLVNRFLGLSQNWIGGSALSWIHQHVVQHHIHTNDVHIDPDMEGNDLVRINPYAPRRVFHLFQHVYLFILICGFGVITVFSSLVNLFKGKMKTDMSDMVVNYRIFEFGATSLFFIRWFIIPCVQTQSLSVLWSIAPMYATAGAYLAFFFVISHNFVGVHIFDKTTTNKEKESFLYSQVASSSNVCGGWLAVINGGLNYQIEHHLFPRMSHTHYHKIAPIVREFCEKKKIPYVHFPTISENMFSCVDHLYKMGHEDMPVKFGKQE
jgi:fatty acid desaturase (delta-4 desaturase)